MSTYAPFRLSEGQESALRILKFVPVARRVEPTRHLYQGAPYTPASKTDLRETMKQAGLTFKDVS